MKLSDLFENKNIEPKEITGYVCPYCQNVFMTREQYNVHFDTHKLDYLDKRLVKIVTSHDETIVGLVYNIHTKTDEKSTPTEITVYGITFYDPPSDGDFTPGLRSACIADCESFKILTREEFEAETRKRIEGMIEFIISEISSDICRDLKGGSQ